LGGREACGLLGHAGSVPNQPAGCTGEMHGLECNSVEAPAIYR